MAGHRRAAIVVVAIALASARTSFGAWTSLGPDGGHVTNVAVDPQQPSTVWATSYSGIYRSTDGGQTWTRRTPTDGRALVVTPGVVLVGRYDFEGAGSLLRTTDGGASWTRLALGDEILSLAVDPQSPAIVYAGANDSTVYRSPDGGATWIPSSLPIDYIQALAADPVTPGTVYAAGYGGIARTTNGGVSWSLLGPGPGFDVVSLAIDPTALSVIYAAIEGDTPAAKSIDGGVSWTAIGPPDAYGRHVVLHPTTPSTVYLVSSDGPFVSIDAGATWTPAAAGLTVRTAWWIAPVPSAPATIYLATEGAGVWRSDDAAASWTRRTTGIRAQGMTDLVMHPTVPSTLWAGTWGEGVWTSTDGGDTWSPSNTALPLLPDGFRVNALAVHPLDPSLMLVCGFYRGVFRSTDGGGSWNATTGLVAGDTVIVVAYDPLDPQVAYAGGYYPGGLQKSVDGGATWAATPLTGTVFSMAIDPVTPSTLYAGLGGGQLWKSIDAGGSWTQLPMLPSSGAVTAIAIDPVTPSTVYVGRASDGVWKTTDGGATFTWMGSSLGSDRFMNNLAIDRSDPTRVWATTDTRVLASIDGGTSWKEVHAGLSPFDRFFRTRALLPLGATTYVGSLLAGGFRLDVVTCGTDADCQDGDQCTTAACTPAAPSANILGCTKSARVCEPPGPCRSPLSCNRYVGCRYDALPDGSVCDDDGFACTADVCLAGECTHDQAASACRMPTVAAGSRLVLGRRTPERARLIWKWKKGAETALGDLGNPFVSSSYQLCVFDQGGPGGAPRIVLEAAAPAGGTCGTQSCWRPNGVDFRYDDPERTPDGLDRIRFHPGGDGEASVAVRGKGSALALGALPLVAPIRVTLHRSDDPAVCFEAGYSTIIKRNDAGSFSAKSD